RVLFQRGVVDAANNAAVAASFITQHDINLSTITMNFPSFIFLLVVASIRRSSADFGNDAEISNVTSMLRRRSDPDLFLQLVASKESNRDDSIPTADSIGNWESGESIYQQERDLATVCGSNQKYFKLDLRTDSYGFETSWLLAKKQSNSLVKIASGPPSGTTYRDNNDYIGGYCLSAGTYKFTINDKFKDGMNGGNGGSYAGYVAGIKKFGSPSGESEWSQRVHVFSVTTSSGNTISAQQITAKNDDGLTDRDLLWLNGHNARRKEWHTRYGKSYVPLQWSNSLKAQAKIYAKELVYLCGGELVHDNTAYGENLAANAGNGAYAELRHPEKIMIRWVEKEADVGWPANSHLTQVLWRATKYVGCYEHATEWRTGMCHIQVCRYARPGNCNMGAYQGLQGDQRWLVPMLKDDSGCLPECPPEGC
ncbi:hypothetical protein ACHAXA_003752, partial [Cyclostephanos tholiformis]